MKEIVHRLIKQGWRCERGRSGHWRVYPPDSGRPLTVPSTPSDHRTWLNVRAQLRRAGAIL